MGRYDGLTEWLRGVDQAAITVSFTELHDVTGPLPRSARTTRPWWGNNARSPQASGWLAAGWVVSGVDLAAEKVTFSVGPPTKRSRTGRARILDGTAALATTIAAAGWPSLEAAIAAHCVFLHPETVAQTAGRAVVPVVRDMTRRGELGQLPDGRRVLFDDNSTPTDLFLWAADRAKGPDVQFNHVWNCAGDPAAYTALWNLCCTPAFLAKATDTHAGVQALLRYRAWDLYGHRPAGEAEPRLPADYHDMKWAPMPEPVENLEQLLRRRMKSAPGRRAVTAAREIGWAYSTGPDPTV